MMKKFLLIALVLIAIIGLPLTVFFSQQKQTTQSGASGSTTLYIEPDSSSFSPIEVVTGDTVTLDIMVDPGINAVSILKLHLKYDPTKLQAVTNPFSLNQSVFSTIIEGPVNDLAGGNVYVTISVGSDPTKAVRNAPAKVGTLQLKAIQQTDGQSLPITFGTVSAAYSVASSDQASQNVLGSTNPAYLMVVAEPTLTPQPSNTPTPTETPTPTALPTATPTPTITPTLGPQELQFNLTLYLHSIGDSGDNVNPNSSLSNKNPVRLIRPVTLSVYSGDNQLITTKDINTNYTSQTGNFKAVIPMGTSLAAGNYIVKVKTNSFLQRRIGIVTVPSSPAIINLPVTTLVAGDVVTDNIINILDYNVLIGCYSDLLPPTACDANKKLMSDLNDDTSVNQIDYNLFLREITVQNGD